jgi:hypothetical protein
MAGWSLTGIGATMPSTICATSAVFSAFRRTSEVPLYRIEKDPSRARKQGAFAIISAAGLVLKRGHELEIVLKYFDKAPRLVR